MITNEFKFIFDSCSNDYHSPLKLFSAVSINKAQGHTMKVAGIDNTDPCFTQGKLYVTCSSVSSEKKLFIHAPEQKN